MRWSQAGEGEPLTPGISSDMGLLETRRNVRETDSGYFLRAVPQEGPDGMERAAA